jgi:5-methylcytosine-specific restriction endonuclease McrA
MNAHYNVVKPDEITTLLVSPQYLGVAYATAREAISLLMRGKVMGMVRESSGDDLTNKQAYYDSYSWNDWQYVHEVTLPVGNPALGSANRTWAIPTVCRILQPHKGKHKPIRVSTKFLIDLYDSECQSCCRVFPAREFTKEHVFPKKLGGSNDDFNLTLTCRDCNQRKGSTYPGYDKFNRELKGTIVPNVPHGILHMHTKVCNLRPEWEPFLLYKKVRKRRLARELAERPVLQFA